jgi:hypothetical protein
MPGGVGGVGGAGGGVGGGAGQNTGAGSPVIGGVPTSAAGGAAGSNVGGAAGGAAGGATRNTNLGALQEIEEAYNKRLDMDVAQLMESFGDIIKTASVSFASLIVLLVATYHSPCFILFLCAFFLKKECETKRGEERKVTGCERDVHEPCD